MSTLEIMLIMLVGFSIIMIPLFIVLIIRQKFRHTFIGIYSIDGVEQVITSRASESIKDGKRQWGLLKFWLLPKSKGRVSAPKEKTLRVDHRGNKVGMAYITDSDEPVYVNYSSEAKELIPYVDDSERTVLLKQLENARKFSEDKFMTIAIPAVCFFVLAAVIGGHFIFWEDLSSPFLESREQDTTFAKIQLEQLQLLKDIQTNVQVIGGIPSGNGTQVPPN